jgi:SAM-dependent methyltransferase
MTHPERKRLERIAEGSGNFAGVMTLATRYCAEIFLRHLQPGATLELGPAEGLMTDALAPHLGPLTVVEGVEGFCRAIKDRHPEVNVVHGLFEDFAPGNTRFRNVILGHVLEHVADPVRLLKLVGTWLAPDGRVLAAVPNSRSLHRQAATLMGLLPAEDALNESAVKNPFRPPEAAEGVPGPQGRPGGFKQPEGEGRA